MRVTKDSKLAIRAVALALVALALATLAYLVGLYLLLQGYALLHPGEVTEVDHNYSLAQVVTVYFRVGYPLLLVLFGWLAWRRGRAARGAR